MTHRSLAAAATGAFLVASLTGCIGQEKKEPVSGPTDEILAGAATFLEETAGVHLTITSSGMDQSVTGLVSAEGDAVKPESFQGTAQAQLGGLVAEAQLVAIDGTVWVKTPILGPKFRTFEIEEYGVPDPAQFLTEEGGVAELLLETSDVERGDDVRCGDDNSDVCTEMTGTLDGDLISALVPSASGDSFDVSYLVDGDGRLLAAALTGEFYPDTEPMTYTITIDEYDVTKEINAPS